MKWNKDFNLKPESKTLKENTEDTLQDIGVGMNLWNRPPTIPIESNLKHQDVRLGENKTLLYSGGYCKQSTQMGNLIEWEQR